MYIRFVTTLAFGLIGVGMVLKVLLEGIFSEWDAFNDIAQRVSIFVSGKGGLVTHVRAEDMLLEAEKKNSYSLGSRLVDQKRRQMQELNVIENRLSRVGASGPTTDFGIIPS
jgi:hypothetical protein